MKTAGLSNRLFRIQLEEEPTTKCPIVANVKMVPEFTGVGFTGGGPMLWLLVLWSAYGGVADRDRTGR